MKETFRRNIENYSDLAKEELKDDELSDELRQVIDWHVKNAAMKTGTSFDQQADIYRLQRGKQEIMLRLKEDLKNIDDPEYVPEKLKGQIDVEFRDGNFYVLENDNKIQITKGEILTDLQWELDYYLNPATVPRNIRKRYLIEKYKKELFGKLNNQLVVNKSSIGAPLVNRKMLSDILLYKEIMHKFQVNQILGTTAEIIVTNFFKKLNYDHGLDIEIVDTDVEQDADSKIDFIIKRLLHERGVDVQVDNDIGYEQIGIQLTTSKQAVGKKRRQILGNIENIVNTEKLSDIIVVLVNSRLIKYEFIKWISGDHRYGGPDKNLPAKIKQKIFNAVLKDIFTSDEIKDRWIKMGYEWEEVEG